MYEEVNKFSKALDVPIMDAVTDGELALMKEFLALSESDQRKVVKLMKDKKRAQKVKARERAKKEMRKAKKRGEVL